MRHLRIAILLVTTLSLVGPPRSALAATEQPPDGGDGEQEQSAGFETGLLLAGLGLASTIVFGSAEVVIATQYESWLPPGWAWTQLGVAVPLNVVAGVMVAAEGHTGLAIATLVSAGWFFTNSLLSLFLYRSPPKKSTSKQLVQRGYWTSITPVCGGVAAVGGLRF